MKLLDRYIAKVIWSSIALVTLMLVGLQIFILFVNQLNDLGRAEYGMLQAALFVLLQVPYQVYLFFPIASLLGSLVGLGILASHSELVVMRSAGMSLGQITTAVLKAALLVILLVTVVGETWVPKLVRLASNSKSQALNGGVFHSGAGVWFRHQNDFIKVEKLHSNNHLERVYQFRFDAAHQLQMARQIERITYRNGIWQAHGIAETWINVKNTVAHYYESKEWDVPLNPAILKANTREPDEMSLPELHQTIRVQKKNHQAATHYQMAYWERLFQPVTTAVMMVLAIPFIFGPLRSSTMGSKLLIGITMGFGFYILNRCFEPMSQILQWRPEIAAVAPTCLFALIGLYLMRRAS